MVVLVVVVIRDVVVEEVIKDVEVEGGEEGVVGEVEVVDVEEGEDVVDVLMEEDGEVMSVVEVVVVEEVFHRDYGKTQRIYIIE